MRDYSFGNFLHELRMRRGLTQYQLGTLVGVSDKAVSKWENGSSKPQSNILYKLSEILEVSVDELLTCKYHSFKKKDTKGVFAMKKQLWNKAYDAMCERYGNPAPIEIVNRFLAEQAEMQYTDMIVSLDLLSVLAAEAKKQGEHIHVLGGTGASFVAYLLGATETSPLKPHYYCPDCRTVSFDNSADDSFDLPRKKCSCGKEMQTDGHNLPFETYRHAVQTTLRCHVAMSPCFLKAAKTVIDTYFKDCKLTATEQEENRHITYTATSGESVCSVTFLANTEFERYQALERATATAFERVNFSQAEVLAEFQRGNTDGITEFSSNFCKNIVEQVVPQSFYDLIQIAGLSHGTGVWFDNARDLINQGVDVKNVIAYRDDVFNDIKEKMIAKGITDTGFAYKVMEDARRGIYAKNGIPDEIKFTLKAIGLEDWFVDSIGKSHYLFPKAHGVTIVQLAATLMWYKIHYPKEFSEIML